MKDQVLNQAQGSTLSVVGAKRSTGATASAHGMGGVGKTLMVRTRVFSNVGVRHAFDICNHVCRRCS